MADLKGNGTLFEKLTSLTDEGNEPKVPVNIFSKPLDVSQSEEARRSRIKGVAIEAVIFAAFITAITAIYSISGIDLMINPTSESPAPSLFFYFVEFVVFTALVGVGNYFLTEKRVNEYNQKVSGFAFDLEDEIAKALETQEAEGITEDEAMAMNKSNGEEESDIPEITLEIKAVEGAQSLTDKAFEAFIGDEKVGNITCCKAYILDSMGLEQVIIRIFELNADEKYAKNNVATKLLCAVKDSALSDGFPAVITSKEINDKFALGFFPPSKYNVSGPDADSISICETYPGALMTISGSIRVI